MKPGLVRAWLLALLFCWSQLAASQVAVPPLKGHVTDLTGTLSTLQQSQLEDKLVAFEARKGSQIALLLVPTTAPEAIEQYALRVAEQWKLGRKKVDDGAILVVAVQDRALRIEVGYGLEGSLNDAVSKRIIEETIVPRFRQQDLAGGVAAGLDQIMAVANGEALPPPAARAQGAKGEQGAPELPRYTLLAVGILLVISLASRALLGVLPGALTTGAIALGLGWLLSGALVFALAAAAGAFVFTLIGGFNLLHLFLSARGGGGGGFGGGGGGGFSGGGGGFGGGGASGRW